MPQRPHYQTLGELLENPDVISIIEVPETSAEEDEEEEATTTVQVHKTNQETILEMKSCSSQGPEYTDAIVVQSNQQQGRGSHAFQANIGNTPDPIQPLQEHIIETGIKFIKKKCPLEVTSSNYIL